MKILGYDVKVTYFNDIGKGASLLGRAAEKDCEIFICKDMPKQQQDSTLLHEAIHIISSKLGLELSEQTVRSLEVGLYPYIDFKKMKESR